MPFYKCAKTSNEEQSKPEQSKTVTATTSQQIITPDSGYTLSNVVINPQSHSQTYTPAQNTASNNMGANHNYRYVNTSGMIVPSGNLPISENNVTRDVSTKATVTVNIPNSDLFLAYYLSANLCYALAPGKGVYKLSTTNNYQVIDIVSGQWASATNANGYKPYMFSAWNIRGCGFTTLEWNAPNTNNLNCYILYSDGTCEKMASNPKTGTKSVANAWHLYIGPGQAPQDIRFY